jgi:hypothetical protein
MCKPNITLEDTIILIHSDIEKGVLERFEKVLVLLWGKLVRNQTSKICESSQDLRSKNVQKFGHWKISIQTCENRQYRGLRDVGAMSPSGFELLVIQRTKNDLKNQNEKKKLQHFHRHLTRTERYLLLWYS